MTAEGALVTFRVAGQDYAFAVGDVIEVLAARSTTQVPGAARRLAGVISWRGQTLAVLDLPSGLKPAAARPDLKSRLLVLRHPKRFALRVDEPGRILAPADTDPVELEAGDTERETRGRGIRLLSWEGRILRLLDPARVLGTEPLITTAPARPEDDA